MDPEPGLSISSLILAWQFLTCHVPTWLWAAPETGNLFFAYLGVFLLLICSALVSGSEVAYFSISQSDKHLLSQENNRAAHRMITLIERPRQLLATILISNNFINIAIVIVSDYILRQLLSLETTQSWALRLLEWSSMTHLVSVSVLAQIIYVSITVVGVTFLLVLLGEVSPKVYASITYLQLAAFMSYPLTLLMRVLSPFSSVLVSTFGVLENKLVSKDPKSEDNTADLHEAIELTVRQEQGGLQEIDLLKSIIDFGDVTVKQIMCPRMDVVSVNFRWPFSELLDNVRTAGFSRLPVFDDDLDNIIGILYVKDLIPELDQGDDYEWQEVIRIDYLYVLETKPIHELLIMFQERRVHISIVIDEYGGFAGIITLEDILEEIIGDIKDEFDEDEVDYEKIDNYNYKFEGRTLLNDVCRIMDVDLNLLDEIRGEADSIAGLLLESIGYLPKKPGEEMVHDNIRFIVMEVDEKRIKYVKVTLPK